MNYTLRNAITAALLSGTLLAPAQDFTAVLTSVEQNNPTLKALNLQLDAEVEELALQKKPDDPEVGVGYLWGGDAGNRLDVEVTQTFELPNVYAKRRNAVAEKQRLASMNYLTERQKVLLKAKQLCIQVVYCNAVLSHLKRDLAQAHTSSEAYQKLFEKGQATVIDRNKAKQACLFFHVEELELQAKKRDLLAELALMNGGTPVEVTDSAFAHEPLPPNFDQWLEMTVDQHPQYLALMQAVQAEEAESELARNGWWPKLSVGYQSEKTASEHFQGLTAGLNLPLWSTGKKAKIAQKKADIAKLEGENQRQELLSQLKNSYECAKAISASFSTFQEHMKEYDNTLLLKKSLDAGQITLLTYLQELQYLHELKVKLLDAEREYELHRAELNLIP